MSHRWARVGPPGPHGPAPSADETRSLGRSCALRDGEPQCSEGKACLRLPATPWHATRTSAVQPKRQPLDLRGVALAVAGSGQAEHHRVLDGNLMGWLDANPIFAEVRAGMPSKLGQSSSDPQATGRQSAGAGFVCAGIGPHTPITRPSVRSATTWPAVVFEARPGCGNRCFNAQIRSEEHCHAKLRPSVSLMVCSPRLRQPTVDSASPVDKVKRIALVAREPLTQALRDG